MCVGTAPKESDASSAGEKSGKWQDTVTLLDELPQQKLQPDLVMNIAAISACEKSLDICTSSHWIGGQLSWNQTRNKVDEIL